MILDHYEIVVDGDTLCFIYEPPGCVSYNTIKINNKIVKVATIETMLLFLLAFLYSDRPYYDHDRIICMAQYLVNVQARNRLKQKGLLKRFNLNCYGHEKTLMEIKINRSNMFKQLKHDRKSPEYEKYFLKYTPETKETKETLATTTIKKKPAKKPANKSAKKPTKKPAKKTQKNIFNKLFDTIL